MLTYRSAAEFARALHWRHRRSLLLCAAPIPATICGPGARRSGRPCRRSDSSASRPRSTATASTPAHRCAFADYRRDQRSAGLRRRAQAPRGGACGASELHLLDSLYGHDMFLKEATRIGEIVAPFLATGLMSKPTKPATIVASSHPELDPAYGGVGSGDLGFGCVPLDQSGRQAGV